jgi:hypothetical protein
MHVHWGVLIALVALLCVGCAGTEAKARSGQDIMTASSDSLRLSLDLPREVRAGQPVPIAIRVENTGTRPLDLYLRGRTIAFDIFVTRPKGDVVWQRLKDEIIPAIIQLKVLGPGEVLELKDEWHQRDHRGKPVPPGSYLVRGSILTDGPALETRAAPLRIMPA